MAPQRFEIGQAVAFKAAKLCATNGLYKIPFSGKNNVYHVACYIEYGHRLGYYIKPTWWLRVKELPYYIDEATLEPVELTSEDIAALVEESISQPALL